MNTLQYTEETVAAQYAFQLLDVALGGEEPCVIELTNGTTVKRTVGEAVCILVHDPSNGMTIDLSEGPKSSLVDGKITENFQVPHDDEREFERRTRAFPATIEDADLVFSLGKKLRELR